MQQAAALNAKARRTAKRVGLRAVKSRLHKGSVDNRGGFMLNDPFRNTPVAGRRFDLEPEMYLRSVRNMRPLMSWVQGGEMRLFYEPVPKQQPNNPEHPLRVRPALR
jgi:hypothetical protein